MAINAQSGGGDFKLVPEGSHAAVCDMVVDLGIQDGGQYAPKRKVYIRFQIPTERVEIDGESKPAVIGRTFTLSLSEKSNLRPFLKTWRGRDFTAEELRGFDITKLAGQPCLLSVTHYEGSDGQMRAEAAGTMKLPQGMPVPKLEGEAIIYDDEHLDTFDSLRSWLQEKIRAQIETREQAPPQRADTSNQLLDALDDDVPF